MLTGQTTRRLAQWMALFRPSPSHAERRGDRPRRGRARALRLEPLEERALLSVTVLSEAFKAVEFTAPGKLAGDLSVSGTQVAFRGEARLTGMVAYDKVDHGVIGDHGATLSASGNWGVDILSGTWDLSGHVESIEDQNGLLSGTAVVDQSHVRGPLAADLKGTYQVADAAVFDFSDFSLDLKLSGPQGSLAFTGSLAPTETKRFDVVVAPTWGDNGVNVAVTVPGRVHQAATRAAPVTQIELYWAQGAKLLSALDDKIPVYWNEASGSYTVTDLPPAPAKATGLAFVAKFDGVTRSVTLPLLAVAATSVAEGNDPQNGNQAVFPVTLARPYAEPVTVWYTTVDGSAKAGVDFQANTGAIVIPAGETTGSIQVPILGNTKYEPDKTFSVRLTKAHNIALDKGYAEAVCTVTNDDFQPTISIADASMVEPAKGTAKMVFTVTLSSPLYQAITVKYETRDHSAKAGEDYVTTSGTLTFARGTTTGTFAVPVKADRDAANEDFYVDLSAPRNATIGDGEGVGTITLPLLSVADTRVAEGDGSDPENENLAVFPVVLSQTYSDPVTVWYTTVDGSAKAGGDFAPRTGSIEIPAGATTVLIEVPIFGDTKYEPDKTFSVKLTKAENVALDKNYAEAACTITNDDLRPTISVADASVVEPAKGTATMAFTVTLSNPSYQAITVKYKTADHTAKAGEDYLAQSGTLTFAPGETTGAITITVMADKEVGDEDFFVDLSAARNAMIADRGAVGTIQEKPAPSTDQAASRDAVLRQWAGPAELASLFEQRTATTASSRFLRRWRPPRLSAC